MQSTRFSVICISIYRRISSSSVNSSTSRESKFMRKLMHGAKKNKRTWYDTSADIRSTMNITSPTEREKKSLSVHTQRRMTVRNKLFMEHITDMMSMGEVADIISGGIEITHVQITPDFKYVNVFWIHSDDATSVSDEALQKCARIIRHELSQLRVIGMVPVIQFVKNKQFLLQKETEKRLAMIEFEKDSEPLLYSEQMQLAASHINDVNEALSEESFINHNFMTDGPCIELPAMRHDVLGLDHHKIMSQITVSLSKSKKAAQRRILDANIDTDNSPSCEVVSNKVTDFLTRKEQQKIFSDFLNERRIEEKRRYRMKQSNEKELLNFKEEIDSNYEENYDIENDSDEYSDEFEDKAQ